jgi:xanthine/uracil/vitamin C permease (AzgA family)
MLTSSQQEKELKDAKFLTEIRAGLTTFFTTAYVIAVNVSTCRTSLEEAAHQRRHP